MFTMATQIIDEFDKVRKASEKAIERSHKRGGFLVRSAAVASIDRSEGPSRQGSPPHTHKGNWLRRAIRYAADFAGAVIGPMFSIFDTTGEAHEFGKMFRGRKYPPRPFMGPALEATSDQFAGTFKGSIGE